MSELKPCPFCGCIVKQARHKYQGGIGYFIDGNHADDCPLAYLDIMETEVAWNRRAPQPDALAEAVRKAAHERIRQLESWGHDGKLSGCNLCQEHVALSAALAAPRPERTYSAEGGRVTRAVPFALRPVDGRGGPSFGVYLDIVYESLVDRDEALRRYGERKDGEAGK